MRSRRDFWLKLGEKAEDRDVVTWTVDGTEHEVSYPAVKNYHHGLVGNARRDPPVAYLARVAYVFDVSLKWLITGAGPATKEEESIEGVVGPLNEAWKEVHGSLAWDNLTTAARAQVLRLWLALSPKREQHAPSDADGAELATGCAFDIARSIKLSLDTLGITPTGPARDSYIVSVCEAALQALSSTTFTQVHIPQEED